MVIVREAAAGPAQNGNSQLFQISDGLRAITIDVWNGRIFANPQSAVHTGTNMFSKLAV
jgi:hypothetical protein